MGLARTVLVRW